VASWLVARDISQRVELDVRPIRLCSLCIHCGEDAPPATTLTGDAPSQHLMRPVQSASRRVRVTQKTTRLTSLLVNSAPVLSGAQYSSSLLQEASPARRGYEDLGHQGTRILPQQQTFVAPSAIFFMSMGPPVGAQYLCACPPSAIKGKACDVTHKLNLSGSLRHSQVHTSSQAIHHTVE
jgi:hypothetical protein